MFEYILNNNTSLEELKEKLYDLRKKLNKCYSSGIYNQSVFSLEKTVESLNEYIMEKEKEEKLKNKEKKNEDKNV
ncbi:MAG: hypothetical protein NZZ41_00950 [Candidatus Dojkabacteria bacterium]|nr:hypothetical protein [Candidatus Dojkabacteria bacterium]